MNPPTKKADIPTKAEFMIVLEWEDDSAADVDLWIQRDSEPAIGYNNKESTLIHLERDDLGHTSDAVKINGEYTIVPLNREVITIRGIVPGEYYVGIHYYREPAKVTSKTNISNSYKTDFNPSIKGTVTFIDVNPYVEVWAKSFTMDSHGTKINMPAVTIDHEGKAIAVYNHNKNLGPENKGEAWNHN